MKTMLQQSMRAALGSLALAAVWLLAANGAAWTGLPPRVRTGVLLLLGMTALFAVLLRRMRTEDRVARLEAELCRARNTRGEADAAMAEADLLLARLGSRGAAGHAATDPVGQLMAIQAELTQLQHSGRVDAHLAARLEQVRCRLDLVARMVRSSARAVQPG